ncbi:MAG: hypothetical protein H6R01_411 [Burkholderiaceae bacterium]|nr:hypothetical protein [Burkholderiaceae bacterium]
MNDSDLNVQQAQAETELVIPPGNAPSPRLPGAELAARRQQLGLTVEQMAVRLKLTQRQIVALESDNYAALPGMAIVRGFVRAYAKAINLDPVPLVAMLQEEKKTPDFQSLAPSLRGVSTSYTETRLPTLGRSQALSRQWLIAIAVVLVLIAVLAGVRYMGWLPNLSDMKAEPKESAQVSTQVAADAKIAEQAGVAGSEAGKLVQKELPPLKPDQVLPATEESAAQPQDGKAADAPAIVTEQPASPAGALVLKAREQSWYEIRRTNGTVVKSGMLHAGALETFEVAEPLQLTLGNAPGVDATLRGAPLEIQAAEGSRVVKLSVK